MEPRHHVAMETKESKNMSKLHEQYAAEMAAAKSLIERNESTDEISAAIERAEATKAELDKHNGLIERMNGLGASVAPASYDLAFTGSTDYSFEDIARAVLTDDRDILRAVAETSLSSVPGLVPEPIWGPMRTFIGAKTDVWNSFMTMPFPESGESFVRTYDPSNNAASTQVEYGELVSAALSVQKKATVYIETIGHLRRLSLQSIQRGTNTLAIAQTDLVRGLARRKETYAAAKLVAAATTTQTLSATPTAAAFEVALLVAATAIEDTFNESPDRVYMAPDRLQYLKGLADSTGRPIYPGISPSNANATSTGIFGGLNIGGAQVVVSSKFPAGFLAVATSAALEKYNAPLAQLQSTNTVNLSTDLSLSEYVATCFWSEGLIKLVP